MSEDGDVETVDLISRVVFENGEYRIEIRVPALDVEVIARGADLRELLEESADRCAIALSDRGYDVSAPDVYDEMVKSLEQKLKAN